MLKNMGSLGLEWVENHYIRYVVEIYKTRRVIAINGR